MGVKPFWPNALQRANGSGISARITGQFAMKKEFCAALHLPQTQIANTTRPST
jgi:hypothetical protein